MVNVLIGPAIRPLTHTSLGVFGPYRAKHIFTKINEVMSSNIKYIEYITCQKGLAIYHILFLLCLTQRPNFFGFGVVFYITAVTLFALTLITHPALCL